MACIDTFHVPNWLTPTQHFSVTHLVWQYILLTFTWEFRQFAQLLCHLCPICSCRSRLTPEHFNRSQRKICLKSDASPCSGLLQAVLCYVVTCNVSIQINYSSNSWRTKDISAHTWRSLASGGGEIWKSNILQRDLNLSPRDVNDIAAVFVRSAPQLLSRAFEYVHNNLKSTFSISSIDSSCCNISQNCVSS